jgi:hypothetical protein
LFLGGQSNTILQNSITLLPLNALSIAEDIVEVFSFDLSPQEPFPYTI